MLESHDEVDGVEVKSITKLTPQEKALVEAFSCGEDDIDDYLHKDALDDMSHNITQTFLVFFNEEILGYFSLTADRVIVVNNSKITNKLLENGNEINRNSIPAVQIHHFAVNFKYQKSGAGRVVMDLAFVIIKNQILPYLGACLITVQSIKKSVGFYKKIGFNPTGQVRDSNSSMAIIVKEVL